MKSIAGCSVVFDIYGIIEDEKYFSKCREAMSGANPHIHINYKGPVANTRIFNVLENYHLFFLPTLGENFGHVIFEALTSGCVLLISDKTPWKDVEHNNAGWGLPLDDKNKFIEKINVLCKMGEVEFNAKSQAAFQYASAYLSSMNLKSRYSSLFQTSD